MKIPIRYFSIGLLTASIIILLMFLIIDEEEASIEEYSLEELTEAVEEKGYRVISQDDFISFSMYLDEQKNGEKQEEKEKKKDEKKVDKEEKKDKKATASNKKDKKEKEDTSKKKDKKEIKDKKDKKERKTATIRVQQGDLPKDIGIQLKEKGIIKNVDKFVKYMEDNNYSPKVQIGSFKVNSDMSHKEIAETLTTYPGN